MRFPSYLHRTVTVNKTMKYEKTYLAELLPGPDDRCERGLHTYHKSPAANDRGNPVCKLCGDDCIDWDRLHRRDTRDVEFTIAQLQTDRFRSSWWMKDVDPTAVRRAIRLGPDGIVDAVRRRVFQSVGRVYELPNGRLQPYNDGGQTTDKVGKMTIVHYGQHATATCCRKCIEVWHGIPQGRELTKDEQEYIVALLMVYVTYKLPQLKSE